MCNYMTSYTRCIITIEKPNFLTSSPLWFSIYINDLPKSCPKLNCIMYADDTTLYSSLENFDSNNIEREINYELEKVN